MTTGTAFEKISFPVPNITGKIENSFSNSLKITLSGSKDDIKKLDDNKNEYHARVWFKNLRSDDDYSISISADIVKIEIVEKQSQADAVPASSKQ